MLETIQNQAERYSRNILLEEIGEKGQKKISSGRVIVVGTGGLGSPAAFYLAASGVGVLGIMDDDIVNLSNLQRQILHSVNDLKRPKVDSGQEKLINLNPNVKVNTYQERLTENNAQRILKDYDIVIDGTDNFESRFLINETCVKLGIPFVHGGVLRFGGQVTTFVPKEGPCYRCVFRNPPVAGAYPTCAEAGVLGVVPGIIGTIQAAEALKYLVGVGELLVGRLLIFDALTMTFQDMEIKRTEDCPVCVK